MPRTSVSQSSSDPPELTLLLAVLTVEWNPPCKATWGLDSPFEESMDPRLQGEWLRKALNHAR